MLVGYNETRDELSDTQLMVLQGRALGLNSAAISKITGSAPNTIQEHIRRAYAKARVRGIQPTKQWLIHKNKFIEHSVFEDKYSKRKGRRDIPDPVLDLKRNKIRDDMSKLMSSIHEEVGNNG